MRSGVTIRLVSTPRRGSSRSRVTSSSRDAAVASPHAKGTSGRAHGEREPRREPHGGLHHRGRDRRHSRLLGDRERGTDSPERLDLEHHCIGRTEGTQTPGIVDAADALVGGERDADTTTDPREVVEPSDGLLDEGDIEGLEPRDHLECGVDVERAVRVDAELDTAADDLTDRARRDARRPGTAP